VFAFVQVIVHNIYICYCTVIVLLLLHMLLYITFF